MLTQPRFLLLLLSTTVCNPSLLLGGEPADAEEVIERFSLQKDSSWIVLPVKIEGKRYQLFLDTGAYCTGYDKPLWRLMGRTITLMKIGSADENITIPFFQPPNAHLGKLALPRDSLVMGTDLKDFREDSGEEIHGFLGMDFLKTSVFRLDFDRSEIVFLRKVGPDPGQRLAVTLKDDQPYVRINLQDGRNRRSLSWTPAQRDPEDVLADAFARPPLKPLLIRR